MSWLEGGGSTLDVGRGEAFAAIRTRMLGARLASCHACDMYLQENAALSRVLPGPRSSLEDESSEGAGRVQWRPEGGGSGLVQLRHQALDGKR